MGAALLLLAATLAVQAPAVDDQVEVVDACLACHAEPGFETTFPSGESLDLFVDRERFVESVHGGRQSCLDCHAGMDELPHPGRGVRTRREFRVASYDACKQCHFDNYTRTLDSAHAGALARGDVNAPTCVDCHGSHEVRAPNEPRAAISQTCGQCHAGVTAAYERSAHGASLAADANRDVPVCTDCHQSHAIEGVARGSWRARTPELCGSCHADAALMERYGLSTAVHRTYLTEFHGMTASLDASKGDGRTVSALCTDCHGVHDIGRASGEQAAVMRANLAETCRSCHPGASDSFPDAWLSHWEPSLTHAPLVYAVQWVYWILIPFIIGGLLLQILLHVWRVVVNR